MAIMTSPLKSLFDMTGTDLFFSFLALLVAGTLALGVTRVYLHPLRKFPGPWLAAATRWYEFYQDVVCNGNYVKLYPKLHEKHGPIVRIAPNHLHINDPDFYKLVFKNQTAYQKAPYFYESLGVPSSLVMFCDPERHRIQRNIMNPLFSKQSVEKLAPLIQDIVMQALDVAKHAHSQGQPLDIQNLYRCITVDVISNSLFGYSQGLTPSKQENPEFLVSIDMFADRMMLSKHFPILGAVALMLPESWAEKVAPGYVHFRTQCAKWISSVVTRRKQGITTGVSGMPTVFDLLLEPNEDKGYHVPNMKDLIDEAFILCIAGSDTTAYTLSFATYYLLRHEEVLKKLHDELKTVPRTDNGMLDFTKLLALPYLTATIKESLRMASAAPGILPRMVPPGGAVVKGQYIPEGTVVSISARIIHFNSDIFPEPYTFRPERWLGDAGKELERWNVAFSKGTRGCIGLNLAYLEIYMCLGEFFTRYNMELYDTDDTSMEWFDNGVARNRSNVKVLARPVAA